MFERIASRAAAFALSGLITLTIVAALAHTADTQHAQACVAYWQSLGGVQQVVITGQRQPRSCVPARSRLRGGTPRRFRRTMAAGDSEERSR